MFPQVEYELMLPIQLFRNSTLENSINSLPLKVTLRFDKNHVCLLESVIFLRSTPHSISLICSWQIKSNRPRNGNYQIKLPINEPSLIVPLLYTREEGFSCWACCVLTECRLAVTCLFIVVILRCFLFLLSKHQYCLHLNLQHDHFNGRNVHRASVKLLKRLE